MKVYQRVPTQKTRKIELEKSGLGLHTWDVQPVYYLTQRIPVPSRASAAGVSAAADDRVSADGTTLTFTTPPHALGPVDVTVTNQQPLLPDAIGVFAVGPTSEPQTYTYIPDAVTVAPPVITSPVDGSTVTDDPPLVEGTGDAGNTVTVTDGNGEVVCTATVAPDGTWSCSADAPMGTGEHTITATQTDPDGNVSAQSDPITFTIGSSSGPGVDNGSQNGGADPGTAPSSGGLASTGSPLTELGVIGLILLVLGFGLTMGTSRRRNQVVKGS